jgi:hypothetical protein
VLVLEPDLPQELERGRLLRLQRALPWGLVRVLRQARVHRRRRRRLLRLRALPWVQERELLLPGRVLVPGRRRLLRQLRRRVPVLGQRRPGRAQVRLQERGRPLVQERQQEQALQQEAVQRPRRLAAVRRPGRGRPRVAVPRPLVAA